MADNPSPSRDTEAKSRAKTEALTGASAEDKPEVEADTKAAAQTEAKTEGARPAKPAAKAPARATAKAAPKGRAPAGSRAARPAGALRIEQGPSSGSLGDWMRVIIRQTPSWLVSMVVHVVALLALALISLPPVAVDEGRELVVAPDKDEPLEQIEPLDEEPPEEIDIDFEVAEVVFESQVEEEVIDPAPFDEIAATSVAVTLSDFGLEQAPKGVLLDQLGTFSENPFGNRREGKDRALRQGGGNKESEQAVAMGLKWLAAHQFADGSWSFDHTQCPRCRRQCRNPGNIREARNGATGMALLPFLGAGQTHRMGEYKEQVRAGLYYLVNSMTVSPQGGSLYEAGGSMYSHGICAIALCEAYAMTHDKGLYVPAQQALNFIAYAQDPIGGGWRYKPRQRGDTSVVGWQIMAMKSGHMAYLRVPPSTVQKASLFLDTVQANNGAQYGYTEPATGREATTAVGLLCRMYLGWKKDNPALQRGVQWMSDQGPSKTDMYYNYYATQVMRHWEGDLWKKWNEVMRDQLVKSQAKKGHEAGSWYIPHGHITDRGGRLYCTSMATMVLEVYYRHMPIYRKQAAEEDFPID